MTHRRGAELLQDKAPGRLAMQNNKQCTRSAPSSSQQPVIQQRPTKYQRPHSIVSMLITGIA